MKTLLRHLQYWGENYIAGPIVIGLLLGATWIINQIYGTDSVEDAAAIVGWLIYAVGGVIVVSLTGLTQHFLFGYAEDDYKTLSSKIHDTCVSIFLLLFWAFIVFHFLE